MQSELNIVMPLEGNYLGRSTPFNLEMIQTTPWERARLSYDLYALHGVWNGTSVKAVMNRQKNDTRGRGYYFTILRDPISLFSSLWDYTKLGNIYMTSLEMYALSNKTGRFADRNHKKLGHVGRNQMLYDFGLDPMYFDSEEVVQRKIKEIEDTFDLVLIADRFEESVVLLKHELCWTYDEVSYLKLNARQVEEKSPLSSKARNALKNWLKSDFMLYDHFSKKFDHLVAEMSGSKMKSEREALSTSNRIIRDKCVIEEIDNSKLPKIYKNWGTGILGYHVNETADPMCKYYGIGENSFLDELRTKQSQRARQKIALRKRKPY